MTMRLLPALLTSCMLAVPASAELTLTSKDGSFVINGDLSRFENGFYHVDTSIGELKVAVDLVECTGPDCPTLAPETQGVRIAVSDTFNPLMMPDLVKAYYGSSGMNVQIAVSGQGATQATVTAEDGEILGETQMVLVSEDEAFELLRQDEADIIFTARRVTNTEIDRFVDGGRVSPDETASETIFGADAVVVAVSPDNPVRALAVEDIDAIFSGQITNWSELGGPDRAITVFAPADSSPVAETFRRAILDPNFSEFDSAARRDLSDSAIVEAIQNDASAVGLVRLSKLGETKQVSLIGTCGIQSEANRFSLLSENYPLSQRLYAYENKATNTVAGTLAAFSASSNGQSVMARHGYVGIAPDVFNLDSMGRQFVHSLSAPENAEELQNLRAFGQEVLTAERLSTTFRFAPGSSQLDNKARADAQRLVELLQQPGYSGVEVLLVGFTDAIGNSDLNKVLSERRAERVLAELVELGSGAIDPDAIVTLGFGESFSVACNDDDSGRNLNRRVEVWLR